MIDVVLLCGQHHLLTPIPAFSVLLSSHTTMANMLHIHQNGNQGAAQTHGPIHGQGPSYVSTYQEVHKCEFERLRSSVQRPEAGSFMHADLLWATRIRQSGRRSDPRTPDPVSIAYIPWDRVEDFVKGEEGRPDAPCKFVCQGKTSNKQSALMFPRWNSYSALLRCLCNMPFDQHSAFSNVTEFGHFAFCLVTEFGQVPSLLHITLSSINFVDPIPDVHVSLPVWTKRQCIAHTTGYK
jgi:hypothetical protein